MQDSAGRTPLHWAVLNGHEEMVTFLLTKGHANVMMKTSESGTTPLHLSADNGKVSIARILLMSCKEDGDSSTQSHRVKQLLEEKCDNGKTALEYAKEKKNSAVVKLIQEVEKGLRKGQAGGDSSVCSLS